jgi:hypothetical protein
MDYPEGCQDGSRNRNKENSDPPEKQERGRAYCAATKVIRESTAAHTQRERLKSQHQKKKNEFSVKSSIQVPQELESKKSVTANINTIKTTSSTTTTTKEMHLWKNRGHKSTYIYATLQEYKRHIPSRLKPPSERRRNKETKNHAW